MVERRSFCKINETQYTQHALALLRLLGRASKRLVGGLNGSLISDTTKQNCKVYRLKRSCIRLQSHVWSLLSLFFTREGLGIISTRWKLHAVKVDVEPPEAVAAQADRE